MLKFCSFHISIFITTNRFPPIYVISRGKVCPDLISTLDSNLKERIPGVCIAGRLGAGTRRPGLTHATFDRDWAGLGVKGRWLVSAGPHCSGDPAMQPPAPARHATWVHVSRGPDVRVRTCTPVSCASWIYKLSLTTSELYIESSSVNELIVEINQETLKICILQGKIVWTAYYWKTSKVLINPCIQTLCKCLKEFPYMSSW